MRRIQQKLHSRRGASLLYALLLFLVASMVSITILSASVTAVKRLNDDREQQQEYLTLSSAARLIAKSISVPSAVVITETRVTVDGVFESYAIDFDGNGNLADILKDGIESLHSYVGYDNSSQFLGKIFADPDAAQNYAAAIPPFARTIRVHTADDEVLKDVEASFKLNLTAEDMLSDAPNKFPIEAVFQTDGGAQRIYLSAWVPTVAVDEQSESVTETYSMENEDGESVEYTTVTTTTTVTTRLTWITELSTNPPKPEVTT